MKRLGRFNPSLENKAGRLLSDWKIALRNLNSAMQGISAQNRKSANEEMESVLRQLSSISSFSHPESLGEDVSEFYFHSNLAYEHV